ncbi:MAG: hypothetical protein ACQESN_11905 [Thermotogota bacterium]
MIACILLPAVLYFITTYSIDKYADNMYSSQVKKAALENSSQLYEGYTTVKASVKKNIENYLKTKKVLKYNLVDLDILISTKKGNIIYPTYLDSAEALNNDFAVDNEKTAKQNFKILSSGLEIKVDSNITAYLKLLIILFFTSSSLAIFISQYLKAHKKTKLYDTDIQQKLQELQNYEKDYKERMDSLDREKKQLSSSIKEIHSKYDQAKQNEEEMLDEMINLEQTLEEYKNFEKEKEDEIKSLQEKIEELNKKRNNLNRKKTGDYQTKRFETLYKNIIMTKKAYDGFNELSEDLQIKAEECINLLNNEPDKIIIKRKVFSGKKHKKTAFEVIFGYSGRLYFTKNKKNETEIVLIGTKKTQHKDMDYLHNL